jgi:hypothetical protein
MIDRLGPEGKYKQEKLKSIALGQFFSQNVHQVGQFRERPHAERHPGSLPRFHGAITGNLINNSAASGGAALSLANLDALYWRVNKPTHWIMPRGLMPQWDTAARNNTLVNQTVGYAEDDFGRRIIKFKGLPILFGYEPDDSPDLLPFNEVGSRRRRRGHRHRSTACRSGPVASTPSSRRRCRSCRKARPSASPSIPRTSSGITASPASTRRRSRA